MRPNPNEDGFESQNQHPQHEQLSEHLSTRLNSLQDDPRKGSHIPSGHSVSQGKKYSLYPDIATGWTPRDSRCHPIPVTNDVPILDRMYDRIFRLNNSRLADLENASTIPIICYFGPRYDNTFYAWYQMPFEFPYTHLEPPTDMKFNNRPFNGQHPTLRTMQPNTLVFDSFFQSANLDCVIKVGQLEYDLYLRVDSNTRGHFQWYNFKVSNMVKNVKYKFNICNMQKQHSLYQRGMKPYVLSFKAREKIDRSWIQDGDNVKYQRKPSKSQVYTNDPYARNAGYYKLSFEYSTIYDNDTVQMAYCIPYSYSDLKQYLEQRRKKCEGKKFYSESRLCLSLGGVALPLITIQQQASMSPQQDHMYNQLNLNNVLNQHTPTISLSQHSQPVNNYNNSYKTKRKCVVIGCRVHPGQSNSSYMMEGLIDFLCSNKSSAKYLRSKIVFKIVPMLNPDGVCFGNYRTGLSGRDFNRQYVNPDIRLFPEIYWFKKLVVDHKKKYGSNFMMFLDLHGHSTRKNVFMYGPENTIMNKYYYQSRIFPRILSKKTQMFRYYSCVFKIDQDKKSTARSIFQQAHNIPLCYTIQASNGSYYNTEILKDFTFNAKMWIQMGEEIGAGLSEYTTVMLTAQKMRYEKYEKGNYSSVSPTRQDGHFRAEKIMERKRERKKNSSGLLDLTYGRVTGFEQMESNDNQLIRYIYQQIEQSEANRMKNIDKERLREAFEEQSRIKQGQSDNESPQNDLEPEKLAFLHKIIKRKQTDTQTIRKFFNKPELQNESSPEKGQEVKFKNQLIQSRVRSSLGNYQQEHCRKLSQPKKPTHAIINLSFSNNQPLKEQSPSPVKIQREIQANQANKKNPKNFQDFVKSVQKWQKNRKETSRPLSALDKKNSITVENSPLSLPLTQRQLGRLQKSILTQDPKKINTTRNEPRALFSRVIKNSPVGTTSSLQKLSSKAQKLIFL